jgi:hypothetical protein
MGNSHKNLLLRNHRANCNQSFVEWSLEKRRFLWKFPIGSYVKLSSAVAAILVGVLKYRTQFWKRTTQESFQQSLVEIGSVVSGNSHWMVLFQKCVWRFDPSINFVFYLQFWSKSDYPSWSYCPFFNNFFFSF